MSFLRFAKFQIVLNFKFFLGEAGAAFKFRLRLHSKKPGFCSAILFNSVTLLP